MTWRQIGGVRLLNLAIVQLKLKPHIALFEMKVSALNQSQSLVLKEHANS